MKTFFHQIARRLPDCLLNPLLTLHYAGLQKSIFFPQRHERTNGKPRRLLVDVSHQAFTENRSGIPRVVNKTAEALTQLNQPLFSIEFVMMLNRHLYTANRFCERICKIPNGSLGLDRKIKIQQGDSILMLDCSFDKYDRFLPYFDQIHHQGGQVGTVINDLMPIDHPEWFEEIFVDVFQAALPLIVRSSDFLFCVSQYTANETKKWINANLPARLPVVQSLTWEQGAEIGKAASEQETLRPELVHFLQEAQEQNVPIFLQVSIIQPRKGQDFALDAFETRWRKGGNERLLYVGRKGWKADELYERICTHPAIGKTFLFVENANDHELAIIYDHATALISPSRGEGYGLPVVEAALRGIPSLVNNLEVYHEVAGEGGIFFSVEDQNSFLIQVDHVVRMTKEERQAKASLVKVGTWRQGALDLLSAFSKQ